MRILGVLPVLLLAACGTSTTPEPLRSSVLATTIAPVTTASAPRPAEDREQRYLDALRIASVPLSTGGQTELAIGRGVCSEVAKGVDPESLADDLRQGVPMWSSDNVTAVIRSALELLC